MTSIASRRSGGFSLIELLTVIAIIGVLASIVIVSVGKVRSSARRSQSLSQMRSVVAATLLYANDNKGALPHRADVGSYAKSVNGGWIASAWYVSGVLIDPYLAWNSPVWIDPLALRADLNASSSSSSTVPPWMGRLNYNIALVEEGWQSGFRQQHGFPVRLTSIVRPSEALLYFNGDGGANADHAENDSQGTVGFADGSVRRIKTTTPQSRNFIVLNYCYTYESSQYNRAPVNTLPGFDY